MGEEGSVAFIYYISTRPLETAVVTGGGEPMCTFPAPSSFHSLARVHIRTGHLLFKSPFQTLSVQQCSHTDTQKNTQICTVCFHASWRWFHLKGAKNMNQQQDSIHHPLRPELICSNVCNAVSVMTSENLKNSSQFPQRPCPFITDIIIFIIIITVSNTNVVIIIIGPLSLNPICLPHGLFFFPVIFGVLYHRAAHSRPTVRFNFA